MHTKNEKGLLGLVAGLGLCTCGASQAQADVTATVSMSGVKAAPLPNGWSDVSFEGEH
jgi:hypothetical protein